jgi:vacuolar-type H+-ATPase subunit H
MKKAEWIMQEEKLIIEKAKQEAERIIQNAEGQIKSLIDDNDITRKAYEQASELIDSAQKNAREIKMGTKQYADKILVKVEDVLRDTLNVVKANRSELKELHTNKTKPPI